MEEKVTRNLIKHILVFPREHDEITPEMESQVEMFILLVAQTNARQQGFRINPLEMQKVEEVAKAKVGPVNRLMEPKKLGSVIDTVMNSVFPNHVEQTQNLELVPKLLIFAKLMLNAINHAGSPREARLWESAAEILKRFRVEDQSKKDLVHVIEILLLMFRTLYGWAGFDTRGFSKAEVVGKGYPKNPAFLGDGLEILEQIRNEAKSIVDIIEEQISRHKILLDQMQRRTLYIHALSVHRHRYRSFRALQDIKAGVKLLPLPNI